MIPKGIKATRNNGVSPVYAMASGPYATKKKPKRKKYDPAKPDLDGMNSNERRKARRKANRVIKSRLNREIKRTLIAQPRVPGDELPKGLALKETAEWLRMHATQSEVAFLPLLETFAKKRNLGVFFQFVAGNRYIVDYYLKGAKIAIELDGYPHHTEERLMRDAQRDEWIKDYCNIRVLRFPSAAVFNSAGMILEEIDKVLRMVEESKQAECAPK